MNENERKLPVVADGAVVAAPAFAFDPLETVVADPAFAFDPDDTVVTVTSVQI